MSKDKKEKHTKISKDTISIIFLILAIALIFFFVWYFKLDVRTILPGPSPIYPRMPIQGV